MGRWKSGIYNGLKRCKNRPGQPGLAKKGGKQEVLEKMGNLEKMLNVNWANDNTGGGGGDSKKVKRCSCGRGS